MSAVYTIFTPLPQLKLRDDLPDYNLGDDLLIRSLEPQLRQGLLDIAKKQKCSDDCLQLLLESELVFCAQLPACDAKVDGPPIKAIFYTTIVEEILKRMFRCLLLFQWVPAPLLIHCQFIAVGSADNIDINTLKIFDPNWKYINLFENIDWRSGEIEPEDITLGLMLLQEYWNKLSDFCQIDLLKSILTNKEKEKGIFASANQYVKQKVEELMKAKYGPNTFIVDDEKDANAEEKSSDNDWPKSKIGVAMSTKWLTEGLCEAYSKEMDKLSQELDRRVFNKRFDRAFQFFTDAFRVTEPHRFISFVTCLESLFCTSRAEITFQIASRVAWFLSPEDYEERGKIFTEVKSLYGLRSEVVHGTKYDPDKVEKSETALISLLRKTFQKVLSDNCIYDIFRNKDQNLCNEYLEKLNLGNK